jgi:hypothetical protein
MGSGLAAESSEYFQRIFADESAETSYIFEYPHPYDCSESELHFAILLRLD